MNCILILEDEPLVALDLKYACEDAGLSAVTAANCPQALGALDEHPVEGAILDVNLGQGETCERVAAELRKRAIPFVLNTGDLNRAGEFLRGIDAPIIAKPSGADYIVERLLKLRRD